MFWGGGGIEKFLKLFAKLSGQRGYTEVTSNTFIGTDQTPSKIPEISFIKLVYRLITINQIKNSRRFTEGTYTPPSTPITVICYDFFPAIAVRGYSNSGNPSVRLSVRPSHFLVYAIT